MEGRSGGQKQGMNKVIRQTDKAKARQRGCGYYHYCSAFNCASSHCYQLPDQRQLRPQLGIQCTQLGGSGMHPIRYACDVQIGELPGSGAGVLFAKREGGYVYARRGYLFALCEAW